MLDDLGNLGNWDGIIQPALQELRSKHPDMDIEIKLTTRRTIKLDRTY
jgi:hypothetical protein